jgi:hypothetical protein
MAVLTLAVAVGVAGFVLVNGLPMLSWGSGVLAASLYFTLIPGVVLGALAFAFTLGRCGRWMARRDGQQLPRRLFSGFVLVGALTCYLVFQHPREVERGWSEQVLDADGSTFVVHRRQWHAMRGFGQSTLRLADIRDSQITFTDLDGTDVTIRTELFPDYLGHVDGRLYLVLGPRPSHYQGRMVADIETDTWGKLFNTSAQRVVVHSGKQWTPLPWDQVPEAIARRNLLVCDPVDLPPISSEPLSLAEKEKRWRDYAQFHGTSVMIIGRRSG